MPRTRPPYPPPFRTEAVRLIRSGHKPLAEIVKDLGLTDRTLRNWVRQAEVGDPWAGHMLAPQRLGSDLVEEDRAIPISRSRRCTRAGGALRARRTVE